MRIAIVYDCLYPYTVGGAERWLRELVDSLADDHQVTYITRRQWDAANAPARHGVRFVPVSPGGSLYTGSGGRRLAPPLLFAAGVFLHFVRRRRDYDVVHCVSYPFFPLLALRFALIGRARPRIYCEWVECLTRAYWRQYAGRVGGAIGWHVQSLCMRVSPEAFVFSRLVESRLRASRFRGEIHRLTGLWHGGRVLRPRAYEDGGSPLILFAGRHVPDKRVTMLPDVILAVRQAGYDVEAAIVGDGPERPRVLERVRELGLESVIDLPGFVPAEQLEELFARAACLVSPSVRDGYGMAAVEAAAAGIPAVVCRHPDNAATELVQEGVNGSVASGPSAPEIAAAVLRVLAGGQRLRESTGEWFEAHAERLSMTSSIERVRQVYGAAPSRAVVGDAAIAG